MAKWLVILNPAAGSKSTPPDDVRLALGAASVDYELVVPDSPEGTAQVIEEGARRGITHFVTVGGDGTTNLAVNVLLGLEMDQLPVVGVLPAGTGCDLLRTFGISQNMGEAAKHLATDDTYDIDVATLEGEWGLRYFANVAQIGVGAAAAETAPKISRRLGAMRYPLAFGVRLPRFPKAQVTIITDRRTYESEALAVILANAQFFAGGWNVAPRATLVDGVLDVQVIDATKTRAPAIVPKVIKGTHLQDPAVRRFSAAEFRIETEPSWPIEADGDLVGNTAVSGRVIPSAIRLSI